jgi:hemoglobin-like flavoprotein
MLSAESAAVVRATLPAVSGALEEITTRFYGGDMQVVVLAEEATGREVVDRLQDRLRRQTERAAHAWDDGHRPSTPPWRGGDQRSA